MSRNLDLNCRDLKAYLNWKSSYTLDKNHFISVSSNFGPAGASDPNPEPEIEPEMETEPEKICGLPEELWLKIFSFVPTTDLVIF